MTAMKSTIQALIEGMPDGRSKWRLLMLLHGGDEAYFEAHVSEIEQLDAETAGQDAINDLLAHIYPTDDDKLRLASELVLQRHVRELLEEHNSGTRS